MPVMTFDLANVDKTVSEAIMKSLAVQLRTQLNLDHIEEIRFIDAQGRVSTTNALHGVTTVEQNRFAKFDGKTRIWVEAEEQPSEMTYGAMNYELPEYPPVFFDRVLGVEVVPQPFGQEITLKFKMATPNRDEARRWHGLIMRRVHEMKNGAQHSVDFSVNLPKEVWLILELIHLLRERKEGYGESFLEYLKGHSSQDLTVVAEASGQHTNLSYARRMARVNGLYSVSPFPEKPTYQDDNSIWECVLEYKATYDRPQQCRVTYPIMVHNQILPDILLQWEQVSQDPGDASWDRNISMRGLGKHETVHQYHWNNRTDAYIKVPAFDDFIPRSFPRSTAAIFVGLAKLEESDKATGVLYNLGDLGDVAIDRDLIQFIREVEYPWLNKPFESFFNLGFYRNNDLVAPDKLECSKDLDVVAKEPLSLRDVYRTRLSLVTDPNLVSKDAFDRLKRYPNLLEKYVIARNEAIRYNVDWSQGHSRRPLAPWMMDYEWWQLNGMRHPSATNNSNTQGGGQGHSNDRNQHDRIPGWAWDAVDGSMSQRTVGFNGIFAHRVAQ